MEQQQDNIPNHGSPTPASRVSEQQIDENTTTETTPLLQQESTPKPTNDETDLTRVTSNQLPAHYTTPARAYAIMAFLTTVTFTTSLPSGLITTSMPTIGADLAIPSATQYWPVAVYNLSNGACLILAGAVADLTGSRRVFLTGTSLLAVFTLSCGLSTTSTQLTAFRALQGLGVALCLPTSVALITTNIAPGPRRNLGFACTGLGQPLGFSAGLVLGGLFIDGTNSWRPGWYLAAAIFALCSCIGLALLPADRLLIPPSWSRFRTRIDWPGALLASTGLALVSYALVQVSSDPQKLSLHHPAVLATLAIGLLLLFVFPIWEHLTATNNRAVLIPNAFWRRLTFSSMCVMVLLSYANVQVLELYCTYFYQNVQGVTAMGSSLRLLPSLVVGAGLNLATGLFVDRVKFPRWLIFWSSALCSVAGVLMATVGVDWPYWWAEFPAQILQPVSSSTHLLLSLSQAPLTRPSVLGGHPLLRRTYCRQQRVSRRQPSPRGRHLQHRRPARHICRPCCHRYHRDHRQ